MYVQTLSPTGRLSQGFARLGSLAVRGAAAVAAKHRAQQAQAQAVAQMASGEQYDGDEPCAPCEEEQRRLEAEAAAYMGGR